MTEFQLPELGEGVYEAELVEWRVAPGDAVRPGQALAEVLTDKATMELPSPFEGVIGELRGQSGDMLRVGAVILTYQPQEAGAVKETIPEEGGGASPAAADKQAAPAATVQPGSRAEPVAPEPPVLAPQAAPAVRRLARELGVDLATVTGSGPGGRVLLGDVSRHARQGAAAATSQTTAAGAPAGAPGHGEPLAGKRIKFQGLRRKIAAQMVRSKREIPHYAYVDECEVTELVKLRASLKGPLAEAGVKLTYLAFFVKAAALALRDAPQVNASLDEAAGEIVLHDRCDVGVAVATPSGLIVPVVREADRRGVVDIAREIERLSTAARTGKAALDDLRGGVFTVTSIGGIGGLISTPIIQPPEVGILGVGKVVRRPVYDEHDRIRPADIVYLSFSFDHRVIDGAIGAQFGNAVIGRLQNPAAMLVR